MTMQDPKRQVTKEDLHEFYDIIKPYLGGGGAGGGGHTIEDSEGTSLTQRETMQFGDGFNTTDDSDNKKTVIEPNLMTAEDMDDVISKVPAVGNVTGGGGHAIEDSEGTALTQRDTLQFGDGFIAEDDDTNEKTVISPDVMQSGDMDDIITPLPQVQGSQNPTGTIISFMGTIAPYGYLKCDGSVLNISAYPRLASFFEIQFGSKNQFGGDGTTTFAVPDLRGEFLRGTGTNSHEKQGDGANVGVHQDGTIHQQMDYLDTGIQFDSSSANNRNFDSQYIRNYAWFYESAGYSASGNNGYFTSRPTNTSVMYCIKD